MVKKYIRRFCLVLVSAFNISCIVALLGTNSDQSAFSHNSVPTGQLSTSERLAEFKNVKTNTADIGQGSVDTTGLYPAVTYLAASFPFTAVIIHARADSIKITDGQFHIITLDKRGD